MDGTLAGAGLLLDRGGGYLELHEGYNGRGPHIQTHTHTHQGALNKLCGIQQFPFHDALALYLCKMSILGRQAEGLVLCQLTTISKSKI